MDKTTALGKIRKLLNLSTSPNEHEAAAALRHARALMGRFDISQQDLELADIAAQPMACKNRVRHDEMEWHVLSLVADVFHVRVLRWPGSRALGRPAMWLLFGRSSRIEVVEYFYGTLMRLLKRKRQAFLKTLANTHYSRTQKNKLVAAFWLGWVRGVKANVQILAMPETEKTLVERKIEQVVGGASRTIFRASPVSFDGVNNSDVSLAYEQGRLDGQQVNLHHGLNGQAPESVAELAAPALRLGHSQ